MHFINLLFILTVTLGQEQYNYDYVSTDVIVANIRRRNSIPIQKDSKLFNSNRLNYRRTKDIREVVADRRFEISEAQLRDIQREAQMRKLHITDMREDEFKSQIREEQMRNEMRARENEMRNSETRKNQLEESIRNNYNQMRPNYADTDIYRLPRDTKWLNIDADDAPEI